MRERENEKYNENERLTEWDKEKERVKRVREVEGETEE